MSDIFISYKREDEPRIEPLQRLLKNAGFDVWWDKEIRASDQWRHRILAELEAAKCVIVIWSTASITPAGHFVVAEASRAHERGTLLQVRIDNVKPPLPFGEFQSLDLISWNQSPRHPKFLDLAAAIRARIAGSPIPAPRAGRLQRKRRIRLAAILAACAVSLALAAQLPSVRAAPCAIPGLRNIFTHEEIRDIWRAEDRPRPLVIPSRLDPFPTLEAAKADATARASEQAKDACQGLDQSDFRLLSAEPLMKDWNCRPRQNGFACSPTGTAICHLKVHYEQGNQTCP